MRLFIAAATVLSFLATPALAQTILSSLTFDLNGDGLPDRAELVQEAPEGDATLDIYVGLPGGGSRLAVHTPDLVWVGSAVAGQQPELQISDYGSLQVLSMNQAIGRDRWVQTLTIAFRQGRFKLAGYTYGWWDTLDVSNDGTCDINLLNGKGELFLGEERVKTTFRTSLRAMPVEDWDRAIPKVCLDAVNSVSNY